MILLITVEQTELKEIVSHLCWVQQGWLCESHESQLEHFWRKGVVSHCNSLRFSLTVFFVLIKLTLLRDIFISV